MYDERHYYFALSYQRSTAKILVEFNGTLKVVGSLTDDAVMLPLTVLMKGGSVQDSPSPQMGSLKTITASCELFGFFHFMYKQF